MNVNPKTLNTSRRLFKSDLVFRFSVVRVQELMPSIPLKYSNT